MNAVHRALLLPGILTLLAFTVLCGLGTWQMVRLAEKEAQTAQIEASLTQNPVPLPAPAEWSTLSPSAYDYRRVVLRGHFEHDKEALVFGFLVIGERGDTREGFFAITPFQRADGSVILVNRGFIPQELRDPSLRAQGLIEGDITLTGIMRQPERRGFFTPDDEPQHNLFFIMDPASLAQAKGVSNVAPFLVDADKADIPGRWPEGGHTVVVLVNNHLQYAITWFALALGLAGVFFVFARIRMNAGS
jgi:surfeit locus 1 family protein